MHAAILIALTALTAAAPQQQVRNAVRYERGDCLYETVACLYDDSCGPLLRLVHAYCYETPGYQQDGPDGARLACDSSCAMVLSVFFNTSAGMRLRECNYSNLQLWSDLVIRKQAMCAGLLRQTDRMLQLALAGTIRTECWLAGLLCASDFSCRATLMGMLDQPCYDGPCSRDCGPRLVHFGTAFSSVFHTFVSCLCGQELATACPQLPSGYLSNRSAELDQIPLMAPLDGLIEQLGRGAIKEQTRDSIWLLRVFEHDFYCRSLKTMISEPNCLPPVRSRPSAIEPLCRLGSVYEWHSTTGPSSTPSSTEGATSDLPTASSTKQQILTEWKQPTVQHKGAAGDATMTVAGASQPRTAEHLLLTSSPLIAIILRLKFFLTCD